MVGLHFGLVACETPCMAGHSHNPHIGDIIEITVAATGVPVIGEVCAGAIWSRCGHMSCWESMPSILASV